MLSYNSDRWQMNSTNYQLFLSGCWNIGGDPGEDYCVPTLEGNASTFGAEKSPKTGPSTEVAIERPTSNPTCGKRSKSSKSKGGKSKSKKKRDDEEWLAPPTSRPTGSPSNSPTHGPLCANVPLVFIGERELGDPGFPLGCCQGDCDNDADCEVNSYFSLQIFPTLYFVLFTNHHFILNLVPIQG